MALRPCISPFAGVALPGLTRRTLKRSGVQQGDDHGVGECRYAMAGVQADDDPLRASSSRGAAARSAWSELTPSGSAERSAGPFRLISARVQVECLGRPGVI